MYAEKLRRQAKISRLAGSSERSATPYLCDTTKAISSRSIESVPSPSRNSAAEGSISCAAMSRLVTSAISCAISCSNGACAAGGATLEGWKDALIETRRYFRSQRETSTVERRGDVLDPTVVVGVNRLAVVLQVRAVFVLDA